MKTSLIMLCIDREIAGLFNFLLLILEFDSGFPKVKFRLKGK